MTTQERFWSHVRVVGPEDCWIWTAGTNGKYGKFAVDARHRGGRTVYAHRFSWELHNGIPVPAKHEIHHTCENPLCVNPAHLTPLLRWDHSRIGDGLFARRARQTTCKRGHPLTVFSDGRRRCRQCALDQAMARKAELHALAAKDPSVIPHGTAGGYFNYGCRCDACRLAQRESSRRTRERRRLKQQ